MAKPYRTQECTMPTGREDYFSKDISVYPLGGDRKLLEAPCWQGPYNGTSFYAVLNGSMNRIISVLPARLGGYGGYSVDSDGTATLSGSHKVRGIGDCWSGESHVWDGKRFVLQNRSGDTQCKSFAGGAWNMPSYLARVLPPK